MASGGERAKALLSLALRTYQYELQPDLPADKRYAAAMTGNAMGIALRALQHPAPETRLLERIGGDDARDLAALARALRTGDISDTTHGALRDALVDHVTAELAITNPHFLKRRAA
ncbi:MAG: DUF6285 domain-containing protein [Methyloligellaceae bacterium]